VEVGNEVDGEVDVENGTKATCVTAFVFICTPAL